MEERRRDGAEEEEEVEVREEVKEEEGERSASGQPGWFTVWSDRGAARPRRLPGK